MGCDHREDDRRNDRGKGAFHGGDDTSQTHPYRSRCKKCGAIRKDMQMGLEKTPEAYVSKLVEVFSEARRVLRDDGVLWLNLGDSYFGSWGNYGDAGGGQRKKETERFDRRFYEDKQSWRPPTSYSHQKLKPKDLVGIPWRVALALQAAGWWLRSDCIWHKPNCMPESVTDRFTASHEYVFMLTKSARYWFDQDAVREPFKESSLKRINHPNVDNKTGGPKDYRNSGVSTNSMRQTLENFKNSRHQGRNRRDVFKIDDEQDPLLAYLLDKLGTDDPERLAAYLADYERDATNKGDVMTVPTRPFKKAHFATFPPTLIEPLLLAGCPARVCVECGEPWVRMVEKEKGSPANFNGSSFNKGKTNKAQSALSKVGEKERTTSIKTVGFTPACACAAPHRPGIVLDLFFGSGTVGAVAVARKRDWLGIELNPDYIKLAKERIYATQPPLFVR